MSSLRLILRSLRHYRWINLSVLGGVALTSAILSGALVVGDSVRESLRRNAEARLSGIGPVFFGGERFFTSGLAERVAASLGTDEIVAPLLQIEGTASNREGGRRVNQVQIVGVDERFWKLSLAGGAPEGFLEDRWIGINETLADRLGARIGDTLIVRIEVPGALSKDAPLSGESEQTTPFTAVIGAILGPETFGNYSLKAEQVPPATLFLHREQLETLVEQPGRANLLLGGKGLAAGRFAEAVEKSWQLDDLQLAVQAVEGSAAGLLQASSSRVFLDEALQRALEALSAESAPVLTYLAVDIAKSPAERGTPYSMVTGVAPRLNDIVGPDLADDQILLSDWLAEDLGAGIGEEITLSYQVVGRGRTLSEAQRRFTVAGVLPIGEGGWDRSWTPEFPGIFDVDGLDDWEPGIPIERDRIRQKDEDYWDTFKTTPKAFVSLKAAQDMWSNRFGNTTGLRFVPRHPEQNLADQLRESLQLAQLGMATRDLPAEADAAVAGSFDFGSLFASMSFFLILAALVLAGLVFVFGIEQRASQIGLLLALGFTRRLVRRLFLAEALLLSLIGAALGLGGGYLYTRLALHGMAGVWQDAAAGMKFVYFVKPGSLGIAYAATILVALLVVWFASRRASTIAPSALISGAGLEGELTGRSPKRSRDVLYGSLALLGALACLLAPKTPGTMAEQGLFFGAGFLVTLAGIALCSTLIRRYLLRPSAVHSLAALGRQHSARRRGRSLAVIGMMAAGVFMVTAINSFRLDGTRGAERRSSGTGGFAFVGESTLPVYEDLDSPEGRKKHGLDRFAETFSLLSLRVSDGDDASCLNLNRAQRPRLLGVDSAKLAALKAFHFTKTEKAVETVASPWSLLTQSLETEDNIPVVPGIIDQNTAIYALRKSVGDTVLYETVSGEAFAVKIVAFLDTSILQGSLLIEESAFLRFFPDTGGYRLFLLDGPEGASLEPIASHLTRMLGDLGLEMRPAAARLNEFNAVQNTYLSIFSTLGGLGLCLGTLGLAILVGRNVMERRGQLGTMQAMGFTRAALAKMILSEHWFLHLSGVLVGLGAAVLAVSPKLLGGSAPPPWGLLAGINGAVLVGGLVFCALAARAVLRGRLIEAIRQE